tara:strand:+ start:1586 stop:3283 length:1698 start_codon:yes stop_codon:yes gene_type:complete
MYQEINEECGVAAISLKKPLEHYPKGGSAYYMFLMLNELQNRGQRAAGFYTFNNNRNRKLDGEKTVGLVTDLFKLKNPEQFGKTMEAYQGTTAIGHVRYATSGNCKTPKDWLDETQPFYFRHGNPSKRFTLGWNGNLANHSELETFLKNNYGIEPETEVDTELMMYLISNEIETTTNGSKNVDFPKILQTIHKRLDGGYSIALMDGHGSIHAFRGPPAIMPLCYGENEYMFAVASETSALEKIGITNHQSFKSGEIISHKNNTTQHTPTQHQTYRNNQTTPQKKIQNQQNNKEQRDFTPCFFQHLYFARVTSILDNISVYQFRKELGKELAKTEPLEKILTEDHIIVPVPDTSIPIAKSMSEELNVPYIEGLIKSNSSSRTFIEKEDKRKLLIESKLNIIPNTLKNKKVILIDDSIVRGSTLKKLTTFIHERGQAKEIHIRSACPPIKYPCYYGIDYPSQKELIAANSEHNKNGNPHATLEHHLSQKFKTNSTHYLPYENLMNVYKTLNHHPKNLCTACLNCDYPTPKGNERFQQEKTNQNQQTERQTKQRTRKKQEKTQQEKTK